MKSKALSANWLSRLRDFINIIPRSVAQLAGGCLVTALIIASTYTVTGAQEHSIDKINIFDRSFVEVDSADKHADEQGTAEKDTVKRPDPADTSHERYRRKLFKNEDSSSFVNSRILAKSDLDLGFYGRFEFRGEKSESNRCRGPSIFFQNTGCRSSIEPVIDFQYSVSSKGIVADRLHVDVDYDSQREFDASNTLSLTYQGGRGEFLRRLELGNVTIEQPRSHFISGAIPLGNYGFQAVADLGAGATLRAIFAQQKGNVVRDRIFTVGNHALQSVDRMVEDYQFEQRRFFFTVDPEQFAGYPNIDILNRQQMSNLARSLPDTIRPVRLYVYRLLIGSQPPNPNGPQFRIIGDPRSRSGQVYEYLREGIDYYADPSLLWISLVRPLSLNNERLVVAYMVRINGVETVYETTGGTPDLEYVADRDQFANLLWDPRVQPGDPTFNREIRSVYRLGGTDIRRETVDLKVLAGSSGDQEKPVSGTSASYLTLFGLSQSTNSSVFDVQNRLWPRDFDHNFALTGGLGGQSIIRDRFIIFPSVRPFAANGLAGLQNPHNDTLYTTPSEYLYSSERPRSVYRLRMQYQTEGSGSDGVLLLGAVQLRPNSERILVDQVSLIRGADYTIDYDLGTVNFTRPDTLFPHPRQVTVQFEEIPLFVETPTSIFGTILDIPMEKGKLSFMALSQSERSLYTRPQLGMEARSTWLGGVSTSLQFDADRLTSLVSKLPYKSTATSSRITVDAELAVSKPSPRKNQQAYIESFEGDGGVPIRLDDQYWYFSSQPANGTRQLPGGASVFDLARAATIAWQTNVTDSTGRQIRYTIEQIDPQTTLIGAGVAPPEQLLWLSLYPLSVGGLRKSTDQYNWTIANTPMGRRWRSIRTQLGWGGGSGSAGADLSRAEHLEFWALIRTSSVDRAKNPTLVFDIGDISENSVAFGPDTVIIRALQPGVLDTIFRGRSLQGFNELNSERDKFSRTFNVTVNDVGLPGDVAEGVTLIVDTIPGAPPVIHNNARFVTCNNGMRVLYPLGDTRSNCTVGNGRMDEEDLDNDNVLNFTDAERNDERWQRYIVDLSDEQKYNRVGKCVSAKTVDPSASPLDSACWVFFKIPFNSPDDSLNNPLLRKAQALRISVVSGTGLPDDQFSRIALARLRFTGAPWLKRDDVVLRGIASERPSGGFMVVGTVGTQDKNVRGGIDYVSPPGISDVADSKLPIGSSRIQVNERSLRIAAGGINQFERAETYYRFPEGQKSFMGYEELRVWARGVSNGWGRDGELQFYMKVGRDASNFYMYRTELPNGEGQSAWLPEIRIDFKKFFDLRARIQNAYLHGLPPNTCTGIDSILIENTPLPVGVSSQQRYAACDNGYIIYSIDPGINAPNLAAVQELSVGMLRVGIGTGVNPIAPSDTLELWVDDVRLAGVVNSAGFAGHAGIGIVAGDFADIRTSLTRRDPHFRQLGDQPSYMTNDALDLNATFHLEKLLPRAFGFALPMTLSYRNSSTDPYFLSGSDIEGDAILGLRTPRTAVRSFTLGIRRIVPLEAGVLSPLLNNLSLFTTYSTMDDRSEYNDNSAYDFKLGLNYNLSNALNSSGLTIVPTNLVLYSNYERGSGRQLNYFKPAAAQDDPGTITRQQNHLIRNGGGITFQPFLHTLMNVNLLSMRDLRDYRDDMVVGPLDYLERERIAGLRVGMERARNFSTELMMTPVLSPWLRARISSVSSFNMLRDPNTLNFVAEPDGSLRLPLQVGNEHSALFGITIDPPAFARTSTNIGRLTRTILNVLQPLDIAVDRFMLTTFDASGKSPSIKYQLGLGGMRNFLIQGGRPATSAAVSTQVIATQSIDLPFGTTLSTRFQHLTLRNWMRHLDNRLDVGDATQRTFPDIGLRWNIRPRGQGSALSLLSASARWVGTKQLLSSPGEFTPESGNDGEVRIHNFPFSLSATWAGARPLVTTLGANIVHRVDNRPGASGTGNSVDINAEIARAFPLPSSWQTISDIRTRLAFHNTNGRTYVINPLASGLQSRLMDNGRRSVTLTADTDVAENLSSSFVISRVASFDRNLNRQFTQTVLSAVLHLQFFAGDKK